MAVLIMCLMRRSLILILDRFPISSLLHYDLSTTIEKSSLRRSSYIRKIQLKKLPNPDISSVSLPGITTSQSNNFRLKLETANALCLYNAMTRWSKHHGWFLFALPFMEVVNISTEGRSQQGIKKCLIPTI